jgi:hypothetical protein
MLVNLNFECYCNDRVNQESCDRLHEVRHPAASSNSHIRSGIAENDRERGAEENIWTDERRSDGGKRKLHSEELHNLYSSPNRTIKSTRIRSAKHVA